ncbi:hypothetical protein [Nostoc sp.]
MDNLFLSVAYVLCTFPATKIFFSWLVGAIATIGAILSSGRISQVSHE